MIKLFYLSTKFFISSGHNKTSGKTLDIRYDFK